MAQFIPSNELMFQYWEPKVENRFYLEINGIPTWMIKKCDRPKINIPEIEIPHINNVRYVKGRAKWDPVAVELFDPISPSGTQILMDFIRRSHESDTGVDGYYAQYAFDCKLSILGPPADIVESWTLHGAWVQGYDGGSMDLGAEGMKTINLNLRYNWATLNF